MSFFFFNLGVYLLSVDMLTALHIKDPPLAVLGKYPFPNLVAGVLLLH